jgi:arabinofuranosyltransferase
MREGRFQIVTCLWWTLIAAVIFYGVRSMSATGLALLRDENLGIDDTNIYFRYARNLIVGGGIVWNVGSERVEGFSSPLWLAICVCVLAWSRHPEKALLLVNVLLVTLSVWSSIFTITFLAVRRFSRAQSQFGYIVGGVATSSITTALMAWWLQGNPPYIVWSILSLLDTGLWGALITLMACSLTCSSVSGNAIFRNVSLVSIALLPWCRPEGVLLGGLGVALFALASWSRGPVIGRSFRQIAWCVTAFAMSTGALFAFRLLYFGYPFPNTYYAKVDGDLWFNLAEGWRYLTSFATQYPDASKAAVMLVGGSVLATLVSVVIRILGIGRWNTFPFVVWGGVIAAGASVCLWVGGDHFSWWRFLQPYWVPLFVGILLFLDGILSRGFAPWLRVMIVAPVVVGFLLSGPSQPGTRWEDFRTPFGPEHEFEIATKGRSVGEDLNQVFSGYSTFPTVGALTVGGIGYTYRGPINDLLGLNNVEMAHASTDRTYFIKSHSAFDKDVFFRQRPQFLFLMGDYCDIVRPEKTLETHDFYARSMKRVHESPEFQNLYVPVVVWNERLLKEGRGLCGYALREELAAGRPIFGYRTL